MLSLTTGARPILDGNEFNRFFPFKADHADPIVYRDGTVEDAVAVMAQVAEKYKNDTSLLAPWLQGATVAKTAENIWNFIHCYIQYHEDQEDVEQIRRPLRTWIDRKAGVDCDCMSVFASSILKNLGIPHYFRITKYDGPEYQHVYVIIPQNTISGMKEYFTIDGVIDGFNKEKKFSKNKDFNINGMKIQTLNGPGDQSLYDYLVETRNLIESNPEMLQGKICPCDALPLFNMLIENWADPGKRASIIANNANVERQNFPKLKFFQQLSLYMQQKATPDSVMREGYVGFSGLGDTDIRIGDNDDGTFFVYDNASGTILYDNLTADQANGYINSGTTSPESTPGAKSSGSWWSNWGSGVANFVADLTKTAATVYTSTQKTTTVTDPKKTPTTDPTTTKTPTPATAGMGTGAIILTIGVVAGLGALIWVMSGKKEEGDGKLKIEKKTA